MSKRKRDVGIPDLTHEDPHPDDYDPKAVLADVEAAKDLLLWMRNKGISAQIVTIGQVQLHTVADHFPRESVAKQLAASRSREYGGDREDIDAVSEFGTAEERKILYGAE